MWRLVGAAVVLLGAGVASAAWGPTYRTGDLGELRRRAMNGGAAEVARGLRSGDRAEVLGAIAGADAAPDAWELLEELAVVAGGWDRSTAAPAAHAAARIARGLDGDRAVLLDVPDDRLAAAAARWVELAGRADRWTDVRVHAVEVVAHLDQARAATADAAPDVAARLIAVLDDPDPELRRAALELLPLPVAPTARAALAARVAGDAAPAVRFAAAQALCAALPDDAEAVLAALGPDGLAGLRALAGAVPATSGAAAIAAARCLAADADPRSQRALAQLRHAAPAPVRAAVARAAAAVKPVRGAP
ncbi:MAG TPA: hypothetical protein VM734_20905 [Kofleriaceae bacterium]|nr:hypothetical protein [Kofleriaceae bacterium]